MKGVRIRFTSQKGKIIDTWMTIGPQYKAELTQDSLFGRRKIATVEIMAFGEVEEVKDGIR